MSRILGGPFDPPTVGSPVQARSLRDSARERLWKLMGKIPSVEEGPGWDAVRIRKEERLRLLVGPAFCNVTSGSSMGSAFTILLIPDGRTGPGPATLYQHFHGGAFTHGTVLSNWGPAGEKLIDENFVVLAIDAPGFHTRLDPKFLDRGAEAEGLCRHRGDRARIEPLPDLYV